jgi:hypothetical protein
MAVKQQRMLEDLQYLQQQHWDMPVAKRAMMNGSPERVRKMTVHQLQTYLYGAKILTKVNLSKRLERRQRQSWGKNKVSSQLHKEDGE